MSNALARSYSTALGVIENAWGGIRCAGGVRLVVIVNAPAPDDTLTEGGSVPTTEPIFVHFLYQTEN